MDLLLERILQRIAALARAEGAAVVTFDEASRTVKTAAVGVMRPGVGTVTSAPDSPAARCAETGRPVRVGAAELERLFVAGQSPAPRARDYLALPLLDARGRCPAVLTLVAHHDDAFRGDPDPGVVALAGVLADVLDRLTEGERRSVERRARVAYDASQFRDFMAALPAVAWIKDEAGRYTYANPLLEKLWNLEPSWLVGRTDHDYMPAATAEALRANDATVRREGRVSRMEELVPTPDGVMHVWLSTKFPFTTPEGSIHVGGVAFDVTEPKALEERLRRNEANLRALVEGVDEGMFIHRDGTILFANAAMLRMVRARSLDEVLGRDVKALLEPDEVPQLLEDVAAARTGGAVTRVRRGRRLDGTPLEAEARGGRIEYEGGPAIVVVVRDVAEQRKAQERQMLTERLAAVGALAAAVGHEINNPLTFVVANASQLLTGLEQRRRAGSTEPLAPLEELARDLVDGAERIRLIVASMRTLARDTSNDPLGPVSVEGAVAAAVQLTRNEVRRRGTLEVDVRPTPLVRASETRLTQVLVNLLTNAAQALPADTPGLTVRVTASTSASGDAVLEVRDQGRGIPADLRARIFDPFFTTKPPGEGSGLGLPIVQSIVSSLGGTLTVDSEEGAGSTFRITLPPAGPVAAARARPRLLIVDDEVNVCRAFARVLEHDYETRTAHSGEEALALLAKEPFDAVVSDVRMPGMTGPELFEELERRYPALARRTVFVSGTAADERTQAVRERVPEERWLPKPVDFRTLRATVAALLRSPA